MITFLWIATAVLALLTAVCMIRSVVGPRNTDRLLAINMAGTIVNAMIIAVATIYKQDFLVDVAILYSILSFAAVAVLSRVMRGVKKQMKEGRKNGNR